MMGSGFLIQEGPHPIASPEARAYGCSYAVSAYRDELFLGVGWAIATRLAQTPVKRRAAFLAGRYCVMKAFQEEKIAWHGLPSNDDRTPAWPRGVVGSISHSDTAAIAAVSTNDEIVGVGVDIERIVGDAVTDEIQGLVLAKEEEELLDDSPLDRAAAFTLSFSAKESFFKAAYSRVGRYFEFHAVKIREIQVPGGTVVLQLVDNLCPGLEKGMRFSVKFVLATEHVTTFMVLRKDVT